MHCFVDINTMFQVRHDLLVGYQSDPQKPLRTHDSFIIFEHFYILVYYSVLFMLSDTEHC